MHSPRNHLTLFSLLITLFSLSNAALLAQGSTITGQVLGENEEGLPNATIMLLRAQDSVLQQFALTGAQGEFSIKNAPPGQYRLQATFLGYENHSQPVEVKEGQPSISLGAIRLQPRTEMLDEVIVKEERIPMAIRKDTIEFDADAFKTQPNAVVEDLLKKLPGVEVGRDGNIRAMGENVERVTVDGKEFFGKDPKLATQNLPADAVDKVQVFDKKSDRAEFSGIDDGQREKTINLALKEDKKKGYFGRLNAGYGDQGRYQAKGNLNRFTPDEQLSFLGMANNVNEPGFSLDDYIDFMGGLQGMMRGGGSGSVRIEINPGEMGLPLNIGGNSGIAGSQAGGVNFNKGLSDKTALTSSMLYNRFDNNLNRSLRRESFLEGGAFTTEEESRQRTLNNNERLNLRLDHDIDSTQSIRFRASGSYNTTELEISGLSENFKDGQLNSSSSRNNLTNGHQSNFDGSFLYRKRLGRPGRVFTADASFGMRDLRQARKVNAVNIFENIIDTLLQEQTRDDESTSLGAQLSYSEPLSKRSYLEWRYAFQRNQSDFQQEAYDIADGQPTFNPALSNAFGSDYTYHRWQSGFRANGKKQSVWASAALQYARLNGQLTSADTTIRQHFRNLLPALRWNYEFNQSQRLEFDYSTFVREPSVQQLQPITDNSDPFNIYIGNPSLRPEYANELSLRYFTFNGALLSSFFNTLSFNYTDNPISQAFAIDENLIRTTQPINAPYAWRLRNSANYSTPIRPLKSRINIEAALTYNRSFNEINGQDNRTGQRMASTDVKLENRFKEKFDLAGGVRLEYTQARYSIREGLNQDVFNQTYYTSLQLNLPLGFTLFNSLDYDVYKGRTTGFNQTIARWNAYLAKSLLENKAEVRFAAYDLLNQNQGISRRAELNYVEDERVNVLARYFLLSFTYSVNGLGEREGGVRVLR
ncbi:MAG: outer membrane beta-barrel protein [Lewinellaceae bacterium]|nr:outer membrane beta-barrel protein [Lewinellaceae bacterium]